MKNLLLISGLLIQLVNYGQCNITPDFTFTGNGTDLIVTNTSTNVPPGALYYWQYGSQGSFVENPVFTQDSTDQQLCLFIYGDSLPVGCPDTVSLCQTVYADSNGVCDVIADFSFVADGSTISVINTSLNVPSGVIFYWQYGTQGSWLENPVFTQDSLDQTICLFIYGNSMPSACPDTVSICETIYADTTNGCNVIADFDYTADGTNVSVYSTSLNVPVGAILYWQYGTQSSWLASPVFTQDSSDQTLCLYIYGNGMPLACPDTISYCETIYADSIASIGDELTELSINIYPNPASTELNVVISNADSDYVVQIIDLTGRIVYNATLASNNTSIDLFDLDQGSYLLHIYNQENPEQRSVKKFLKQ